MTTQPERGEQWRVSGHNGLWTEDIQTKAPEHSEFLEKVLRVVHNDGDEEYEEFAVGAADAVPLAKKLNTLTTERDAALTVVSRLRQTTEAWMELPCTFWACDGPDEPFVLMKTCSKCQEIQENRAALARANALLEGK